MPGVRLPNPDRRATLDFMPASDVPVIRQPFREGDMLPFWAIGPAVDEHHLYNIVDDPGEEVNRVGDAEERRMIELLRQALIEVDAPQEQWQRLGLA